MSSLEIVDVKAKRSEGDHRKIRFVSLIVGLKNIIPGNVSGE